MSRTYKATGINLKAQAFGEYDRLVTILTKEYGLVKAIAPGARKHNSSLGGRSAMFVVNEVLIAKGRSLDKITQANTVKSYPGLAKNLGKLAASQYLAEIVLCQALSENPQSELYELLNEHLARLESVDSHNIAKILALLSHGIFQFLALAGFTPQVEACCLTQRLLIPDFTEAKSQVGFSINAGGTVCLAAWERLRQETNSPIKELSAPVVTSTMRETGETYSSNETSIYETIFHHEELPTLSKRLNANELYLLQQLSQIPNLEISNLDRVGDVQSRSWLSVEQLLRQYVQYHFGRSIRSAALIDSYFAAHYDATV
ncbi:DNA repair protein RecO [Brunnivagina elsteri]|uniref:DNA repair protein RecO n=1 Tax=Brunnivagina elsteri CCALA 953 TaxID=987040 RepID=A0A2A2TH46_9CYAN|nr:DNA repair protein RecO [Calothrix elsteri]PAX52996.1 DNA repair protein RecO [Calothrix elsteri CCALA 953]